MRLKYPDMPLTIEEEMEQGVARLGNDEALRRREGLIRDGNPPPIDVAEPASSTDFMTDYPARRKTTSPSKPG